MHGRIECYHPWLTHSCVFSQHPQGFIIPAFIPLSPSTPGLSSEQGNETTCQGRGTKREHVEERIRPGEEVLGLRGGKSRKKGMQRESEREGKWKKGNYNVDFPLCYLYLMKPLFCIYNISFVVSFCKHLYVTYKTPWGILSILLSAVDALIRAPQEDGWHCAKEEDVLTYKGLGGLKEWHELRAYIIVRWETFCLLSNVIWNFSCLWSCLT